jgi:alginate O-acetyltransferase complex protein AlgJ
MRQGRRLSRKLLIAVFCCILWLPALQMKWPLIQEPANTENRELAAVPGGPFHSLAEFTTGWELYLADHFGFRPYLIRWNSLLRMTTLGVSPVPSVLLGKESWLFYNSDALADGNTFDDFRGVIPLTQKELIQLQNRLEDHHREFSRHNIAYLVVITPNKSTIYSEYLPDRIRRFRPVTRLDQFMRHMEQHSKVPVLDLRQALFLAKESHPVYWKTDSHWNTYGAYVGYVEILRHLEPYLPELQPFTIREGRISVERSEFGGDLAEMLALKDVFPEDFETRFALDEPHNRRMMDTLIFRHDSFGDGLYPYLTRHFKKLVNIAPFAPYKFDALVQQRPHAVIHVFAERYITQAIHDDFYHEDEKP